jgi:hypothetical protein
MSRHARREEEALLKILVEISHKKRFPYKYTAKM